MWCGRFCGRFHVLLCAFGVLSSPLISAAGGGLSGPIHTHARGVESPPRSVRVGTPHTAVPWSAVPVGGAGVYSLFVPRGPRGELYTITVPRRRRTTLFFYIISISKTVTLTAAHLLRGRHVVESLRRAQEPPGPPLILIAIGCGGALKQRDLSARRLMPCRAPLKPVCTMSTSTPNSRLRLRARQMKRLRQSIP